MSYTLPNTEMVRKMREAEMMAETRNHTAKGPKPMPSNLGPETMVMNHGYDSMELLHAREGFVPHESAAENRGREEALRIVGAKR